MACTISINCVLILFALLSKSEGVPVQFHVLPSHQQIYVNGVPIDPWQDDEQVFLVRGLEQDSSADALDIVTPDYSQVEQLSEEEEMAEEEEDETDPKKRKNFMSRDLLEAFKKFAKEQKRPELEEKLKHWEEELKKKNKQANKANKGGNASTEEGGAEGGTEGGTEGSTEGGDDDSSTTEGEGGEGSSESSDASSEAPSEESE